MWAANISKFSGPRYLALASAIAEAINSGELPSGAQLPPQRELAEELDLTVGTVGRAYSIVKKRNLVVGKIGQGTFVCDNQNGASASNNLPETEPGTIDLARYRNPVEGLSELLISAMTEAADNAILLPLHGYPPANGYLTHRVAGAKWIMNSGLQAQPENVIVCCGAQQALLVALAAFAKGGDEILAEELTYSGLKSISAVQNLVLKGIKVDADGIIPESLDEACESSRAKILYLQPSLHNPTTSTLPETRRHQVAEICRKHDLILIEDDTIATLMPNRPAPLATLAPERTIFITSLSKSISPALRVGYLLAPPQLVDPLVSTLHAITLANSQLVFEVASTMIMNGAVDDVISKNFIDLSRRHETAAKMLPNAQMLQNPAAFFAWLELPAHWSAHDFSQAVRAAGVSVVPADSFSVGDQQPPHAVRLALTPAPNIKALESGLDIVKQVLEAHPRPKMAVV